ncbi:hypothetical protein [Asticcacaulis sp. YBE204]|uniref:hypothetical protein n=1 Tax=Asticcacaulis sp. YBE204 TaxID=1282363 RepID=UPI0003C3D072|nr:hypothetical protein [Asticcacaulis sp. YBE204]ESQ78544.1 hypothetical protein AEYBE204_13420 [Asticcacaulis sp. YBE204]
MNIRGFTLALLLAVAATSAHAELEDGDVVIEEVIKPAAKPKPKPKPKAVAPKPAAKPPAKLPDAPIPYHQLKAPEKAPVKTADKTPEKPHVVTHDDPPVAVVVNNLPPAYKPAAPAVEQAPPPPPEPPISVLSAKTHDLKCETQVVGPKGLISKGIFYLEVSLSEVSPDENARFKVLMADPRHDSLLKDTVCETITCAVKISPNFYDLYNSRTKRGAQLRVTLDRHTGAFLARKTDGKDMISLPIRKEGPGEYEQGYCQPQSRPDKLF